MTLEKNLYTVNITKKNFKNFLTYYAFLYKK